MDFRDMEYFTVIAREKNLTKAANQLYLSQPTLTKCLQRLETEIGLPLFQRDGKQFLMTYVGERFLDYANRMLELKHSMEQEMIDIKKLDIGILRVGMAPFRCSFALPAVLPTFHQKYPHVDVEIMESDSTSLDRALMAGEIDLAFYNMSEPNDKLHYELMQRDTMYAILRSGHPIREKAVNVPGQKVPGIRLEWLKDEVFILQNQRQRHGEYIMRELKDQHIIPKKILRSTNMRAAASLAVSGYGVAFLSGGLLAHYESPCDYDYYSLIDVATEIRFVASWHKNHYLPGYAAEFIRLVKEDCERSRP